VFGIILIVHDFKDIETINNLHSFYSSLDSLIQKYTVEIISIKDHGIEKIDEIISNLVEKGCKKVIIQPILLTYGKHFKEIEFLVNNLRSRYGIEIQLTNPLLRYEDIVYNIISKIVQEIEISGIQNPLLRDLILSTGDYSIIFNIKYNRNIEEIANVVANAKYILFDDMRIINFIDTKLLKPGVRIRCEFDIESFSYPPDALIVIGQNLLAIKRIIQLIKQGLKPCCIIATPPCLNFQDVLIKLELLNYDIPCIITSSFKGGLHVAGIILNSLLQISHIRSR